MRSLTRAAALLALSLVVTAACGPQGTGVPPAGASPGAGASPAAARQVDLLRIATTQDESSINPFTYVTGYPGWPLLMLQFDTLMAFDLENVPQPWLAKEVKPNATNTVWELTLESGVKWHDGRPFTADDVKFTVEYFQKNVHGRFSTPLRDVASVEVRGPDKVVLTMKGPSPAFRTRVLADVPMMPRHVWENEAEPRKATDLKFSVGTGPYKLVEHKPDQIYRFQANPDYFKGRPAAKEIVMPIIKEAGSAFSAVRVGELDSTVRSLQPELVKDFEAVQGLKVARGPEFAANGLWINTEKPGLDRKEVRQAMSLAIDRKRLVDTVFLGMATAGSAGYVHPQNALFNQAVRTEFDVAKANALLDRIGAARGTDGTRVLNGRPLRFEMLVNDTGGPLRIRQAELISQQLREVGITTNVRIIERNAWTDAVWPGFDVRRGRTYDLTMHGWTAPTQFEAGRLAEQVHSDPNKGSINVYGFKDPAGDALADRLISEGDPQKRIDLGKEMQAYFADQLFIITTAYADGLYAYRATTYDGWKFQKGQGIFHKNSLILPKQ